MYAEDLENYKRDMDDLIHAHHTREKGNDNSMTVHSYGTLALMCPHCYSISKHHITIDGRVSITVDHTIKHNILPWMYCSYMDERECMQCGEYANKLIELDPNIADTISILNRKGFYTKFCCEGHGDDTQNCPYIYFQNKYLMDCYAHTIPITWYVDISDIRNGNFIIRSESANYEECLLDIYEWAKGLPFIKSFGNNGFVIIDESAFTEVIM